MKKTLITLLVLMGAVLLANAQSPQTNVQPSQNDVKSSQFHIGVVFPRGDDGDAASTGFNLGYKYYKPLTVENLSFVFAIDVSYNGTSSDEKDRLENYYSGYDVTFRKYINIPVTLGLNYLIPMSDEVGIYGEFGLGANYSIVTPLKTEKGSFNSKVKFTPGFNFQYGVEGGVLLQKKYSISIKYNDLGSYKYKYKASNSDGRSASGKEDRISLSSITLALGVRF